MPNQIFLSCFILFITISVMGFFPLQLFILGSFRYLLNWKIFKDQIHFLMESFDLFDIKNGNDEVLKIICLKMDHPYFEANQTVFLFKEAPISNS